MSDLAGRLLQVLERHISRINAEVILARASTASHVRRDALTPASAQSVLQNIERSLRIFIVTPARRDRVMRELWDSIGSERKPPRAVLPVKEEADVGRARLMARTMCLDLGVSSYATQGVATVVSELARNLWKYATDGGELTLEIEDVPRRFVITSNDEGPGIPNLDEIMGGGYKSRTGMGLGLLGTKRLATSFHITSGAGGTHVRAEVLL